MIEFNPMRALADQAQVDAILTKFIPERVRKLVEQNGTKIRTLQPGEKIHEVSPLLNNDEEKMKNFMEIAGDDVLGVFIRPETTIYLAELTPETLIHEYGHALDCALGDEDFYFSDLDFPIQWEFVTSSLCGDCITPYAATGLDEFFAECFRVYLGVDNDKKVRDVWPPVSREILKQKHPRTYALLEEIVGPVA